MTKDFRELGKSFQEKLALIIVRDRAFADQISEVLSFEYFDLKYLRKFVKEVYDYRKQHDFFPTDDVLQIILNTKYSVNSVEPPTVNLEIHKFFSENIKECGVPREEEKFIKDKALDFCRKQNYRNAVFKSDKLLETCSFDDIKKLINEALKLGSDNNFGYDYKLDFNKRYEKNHRVVIPTPWDEINKIMGGGHGKGELGVIIAPTGGGKSLMAVALGSHAIKMGFNVVYYTLELLDTVIGQRFDSCITGIDLDDLKDNKEAIFEQIKNVPGKLIVKEYPAKRASIHTIERHLERLIVSGFTPDMVIVDYGDLLKPVDSFGDMRISLGSIYEELRGLAKHFNVAMWSPTQSNRKGLNKPVVTMEEISEAFNKCFTADFIISLSRIIRRFFVPKNRNGRDGIVFPVNMRTDNVFFEVLPPTGESLEEIIDQSNKVAVSSIASRWNEFKQQYQKES